MTWTKPETAIEVLDREAAVFDQMSTHLRTIFSIGVTFAVLAGAVLTFIANGGENVNNFLNTRYFALSLITWLMTLAVDVALVVYTYWDTMLSRRIAINIKKDKKVPDDYQVLGRIEVLTVGYILIPLLYVGLSASFVYFVGSIIEFFANFQDARRIVVVYSILLLSFVFLGSIFWVLGHIPHFERWIKRRIRNTKETIELIRRVVSDLRNRSSDTDGD